MTLRDGRVGFRIDNRTDLESGTHIIGRFPGKEYGGSVEELLANGDVMGSTLLTEAINKEVNVKKVVSILRPRTRAENVMENPLGGGNLSQTYIWTEDRNNCWWMEYLTHLPGGPLATKRRDSIAPWPDYWQYTQDVTWP